MTLAALPRRILRMAWPYLLLMGMCTAFFWDALFAGKAFMMRDTMCDFVPWRAVQQLALWSGQWPLWNPLGGCGHPFVGDPFSGSFYPLWIPFHLLPLKLALKLTLLMHTFIGAAGAYTLARQWRCAKIPSLIGATSLVFSTFMLVWLEYFPSHGAFSWVPWVWIGAGWMAERISVGAAGRKRAWLLNPWKVRGPIGATAIALAVQFSTGAVESFAFLNMLLAAYVIVYVTGRYGWQTMLCAVQGMCIAVVVMALLMLPDLLLLPQGVNLGVRAANFDPQMSQASIHPMHWLTLILPFLFGKAGYPDTYFAKTIFEYWAGACYIGILPLLLAMAALALGFGRTEKIRGRRWLIAFCAACVLFGALAASGLYTPVFPFLNRYVPGFTRMRWPGKCLLFAVPPLTFLVSLGADELLRLARALRASGQARGWLLWLPPAIAGVAGIVLLMLLLGRGDGSALFRAMTFAQADPTPQRIAALLTGIRFAAGISLASMVALALLAIRRVPASIGLGAALTVTFVDVGIIGRQVHPIGPDSVYDYDPAVVRSVMGEASPLKRLHSNYSTLAQRLYGNPDPEVFLAARRVGVGNSWIPSEAFTDLSCGMPIARYNEMFSIYFHDSPQLTNRLADIMGITHLVAPTPVPNIWRGEPFSAAQGFVRSNPLPRALLLPHWFTSTSLQKSIQVMFDPQFDPRFSAVLEADESGNAPPSHDNDTSPVRGGVESIDYRFNSVRIRYQSNRKCLLLLNDTFYPGWRATADGTALTIYQANGTFRGVVVPAGSHEVLFEYAPWQFTVGFTISVCTLTALVGVGLYDLITKIRSRRKAPAAPNETPDRAAADAAQPIAIPLPRIRRR